MGHHNQNILDIIHGDIKPQNTLTFDSVPGAYAADFGYPTQYAQLNDLTLMPRSQPRNGTTAAPRLRKQRKWTPFLWVCWYYGCCATEREKTRILSSENSDLSAASGAHQTSSDFTRIRKAADRSEPIFQTQSLEAMWILAVLISDV